MPDNDRVDEFIQEVKKLAYDIPGPNPYTPMLLSHCLEAERRLVEEHSENENAGFEAFKTLLNTYPSAITKANRFVAQKEMGSFDLSASAQFNLHNIAFGSRMKPGLADVLGLDQPSRKCPDNTFAISEFRTAS